MLLLYILSHPDFDSGLQPQLPSGTWPTERGRSPKIIWFQSAKDTHRYRKRATAAARPTAPTGQQKAIQSNNPIPLIPKKKEPQNPCFVTGSLHFGGSQIGVFNIPKCSMYSIFTYKTGWFLRHFFGTYSITMGWPHFSFFRKPSRKTTKNISGLKTWHICPVKVTSWWPLGEVWRMNLRSSRYPNQIWFCTQTARVSPYWTITHLH